MNVNAWVKMGVLVVIDLMTIHCLQILLAHHARLHFHQERNAYGLRHYCYHYYSNNNYRYTINLLNVYICLHRLSYYCRTSLHDHTVHLHSTTALIKQLMKVMR